MAGMKFITRLIILIVAVGLLGTVIYVWQIYRIDTPSVPYVFKVEPADTLRDVARKLKEQRIVRFESFFYISHFLYAREKIISAGGYVLSSNMNMKQAVRAFEGTPTIEYITIPPETSKTEMGKIIGKALGWKDQDIMFFPHTLSGMQWQKYKDVVESEFLRQFSWSKGEREAFLSLSALYYEDAYDFFKHVYEPGTYQIPLGASRAQAAGVIIDQFAARHSEKESQDVVRLLDPMAMDSIAKLIKGEMELLPDIVTLPPSDVTLRTENGRTYLLFTTEYWNKGRGPVELVGDPKTKSAVGDIERKVFQRIYRLDGDYRERLSGTFLWHKPHLHYHFIDFAEYTLMAMEEENKSFKDFAKAKSTFCIRDSEPIDLAHPGAGKIPSYTICGRERQGISAGWSDAYYYNYVDQRLDVTDAPVGQYLLRIDTNPEDRIEEITKDNNRGEAVLFLNVPDGLVEVIEERRYGE
jgi:cell division protein YceG involved in septum cleavage